MTWQPGQSGNPEGPRKHKPFRDALRMEAKLAENGEDCFAPVGSLRWNARQLLKQGDVQAIRELADRLDGKVPAPIVGDDEHDAIRQELTVLNRVIVDPAFNPDSPSIPPAT